MFEKIIALSVRNKSAVLLGTVALIAAGIYAITSISIDAVPDITNNQVQIVTTTPSLAAEDVENFITYPIELAMANLPDVLEIRSISRYGLSLVTVVFDDEVETMRARQFVAEQLRLAAGDIPSGFGTPEMMPITTGLGEIYQYVLDVDPAYADQYDIMELRSIQDWLVKRQLAGIEGVIETSSFGGYVKQYEVGFYPEQMNALGVTLEELVLALEINNANTGGGYISRGDKALYIRTEGALRSLSEIELIPVARKGATGSPILVRDLADVRYGHAQRYGAMTKDGKGEVVGGITLMLKNANAKATVSRVKDRIAETQRTLPPGISIAPYLDRSDLVDRSIATVIKNLAEGGILVAVVLIFFLGHFRSGILVASVIPLAMLFALVMMNAFGISANLMSLGAIDFGIVVDGAVIIVEGILYYLAVHTAGKQLTQKELDGIVIKSSSEIYGSAAFGILIILVVFLPILQLQGVEGKTFRPMALTLMFALGGALLLSLTYVPVMATCMLRKVNHSKKTYGERLMERMRNSYASWLDRSLKYRKYAVPIALLLFAVTIWRFSNMGSVFLPELEEGDLAMQMAVPPGSNLETTVAMSTAVEAALLKRFPEINHIVSKIGTAEVPTDPMAIEDADIMILMKPKSEWTSAESREEIVEMMKETLEIFPEVSFEFTQPIQLRFNELLTGSKSDVAVKIFGPDPQVLLELGQKAEALMADVRGADDIKLERTEGLQQLVVQYDRENMAWYGVDIEELNHNVSSAFAGAVAGIVLDGEKRFELVVRLNEATRKKPDLSAIYIETKHAGSIPLSEVATLVPTEGAAMISRENTQRRIAIGVNVRKRSLTEVVADIQAAMDQGLDLPSGYTIRYEGEFQNFIEARDRLLVAVPIALALILLLLFAVYRKWSHVFLVFSAVPLSIIGGIWFLSFRGMPFSISAGIGFIALFGVSVLNGIVMISHINLIRKSSKMTLQEAIVEGASDRLRPVLITGMVATFGFIPMALSTSAGAEVQKPLATVVIGGLITATILTLVVLPMLYQWVESRKQTGNGKMGTSVATVLILIFGCTAGFAQETWNWNAFRDTALSANPQVQIESLHIDIAEARQGEGWQLAPTEVSYGFGQLNRADISDDHQWTFSQDFGSIPGHIHRKQAFNAEKSVSQAEYDRFIINYETDMMMDYLQWVYAEARLAQLLEQRQTIEAISKVIDERLAVGNITLAEKYLFDAQTLGLRKQYTDAQVLSLRIRQQLENRCLFDLTNAIPSEGDDFAGQLPIAESMSTQIFFLDQAERIRAEEYRLKMQRAAFFPSLSANYQVARLEGENGADAVTLGVALPIWYAPDKARVSQSAIRVKQESSRLEIAQFQADAALKQAVQSFALQQQLYENEGSRYKSNARELLTKALDTYQTGEADAYQTVLQLVAANELYIAYLEICEAYGLAKINLYRFRNQ
jgi:cobalt-zinc-cadmium resistance protein CzcA